jgi:hypothetical protein
MAKYGKAGPLLEGTAYGVLNEILSQFRSGDGYARPSRYEILIQPPNGFSGEGRSELKNIWALIMGQNVADSTVRRTSLRCSQISFPGRTLDSQEDRNIYGPVRNIVQGFSFAELQAQFQLSTDLREKTFFETWQRLAFNPQTFDVGYYNSYVGGMQIYQLDEQDRRQYGVELVECFPKSVEPVSLDYAAANTISTVGISFSYRYWKNLTDEGDLPRPLGERIGDLIVNNIERNFRANIPKVLSRL